MIRANDKETALLLAPRGRDAAIAGKILQEAGIDTLICGNVGQLQERLQSGADIGIVAEEALDDIDARPLRQWIGTQPPWSDFPFVILTKHGGGLERNPTAASLTETFGNVAFLERPFHPTTLVSVVQTALRGRRRQYECQRLNDELEARVGERTSELAAANRQLLGQIEEREKVESTLRQMQRLEAVGQLTSGVAHDFNNLLTVVLGNITFLEKTLANAGIDGKAHQRLQYMRSAAERGAKLTDQLLSFSRRQLLEPAAVDLSEAVHKLRDLLQSTIGSQIHIETMPSSTPCIAMADQTQLELAILNLAINARDAMPNGGALQVATGHVRLGEPTSLEAPPRGDYVEICVSDTGTGIPEEIRTKVFEPFFTTKEVGKGSGLGLSQVLGFAKQSGGGMQIDSELGKGTAIRIYLPPAGDKQVVSLDAKLSRNGEADRDARILLVDDDNAVREVTATYLRDLGYHVEEAGSGGAALEILESTPSFDLLLVDFAMPGMNGRDLARRVRAKRAGLPILFITGFAQAEWAQEVSDKQIVRKPIDVEELSMKIRSSLAGEPHAEA